MVFKEKMTRFLQKEVTQEATSLLSARAKIRVRVIDPTQKTVLEEFSFVKTDGNPELIEEARAKDPDLTFTLTPKAIETLLTHSASDLGSIGITTLKLLSTSDIEKKIQVQLHIGYLSLIGHGYLKVIRKAGSSFARFLASRGFSVGQIKKVIARIRRSS